MSDITTPEPQAPPAFLLVDHVAEVIGQSFEHYASYYPDAVELLEWNSQERCHYIKINGYLMAVTVSPKSLSDQEYKFLLNRRIKDSLITLVKAYEQRSTTAGFGDSGFAKTLNQKVWHEAVAALADCDDDFGLATAAQAQRNRDALVELVRLHDAQLGGGVGFNEKELWYEARAILAASEPHLPVLD